MNVRRVGRGWFVVAAAVVVGAGCGADAEKAGGEATWTRCHDDFECATVEVPVDYDLPDGPKLGIAVVRAPASDPEHRLGTIVVNPGGPGAPMVDRLVAQYAALRVSFLRAFERFDVVAFDVRGTGQSAPLRCVPDAVLDEMRASGLTLEADGDVERIDRRRSTFVDGCRASAGDAMLENLHTVNAARDLERIRQALGEPKLTFLGLSYGSWLGATYATMFPDKLRTSVLDAPVFLPADNFAQIGRRARGIDDALQRFFDACGASPSCPFHGGSGAGAVSEPFDALVARADRGELTAGGRPLSSVDFALGVTSGLRSRDRASLAADLAKAEAGDASAMLTRADAAAGKRTDGTYDGSLQALLAIGSLDLPFPAGTTTSDVRTFIGGLPTRRTAARGASVPWSIAASWPWHTRSPAPAIDGRRAPPMLVVATRHDPLSLVEDGVALVDAFANGSPLLTYEGDGHVAVLQSDCVRGIVTDWLLDPSAPPRAMTCPAD